jgi:3-oxoacid CoA-transferase
VKIFNGKKYILENSIVGDFSLVKAWKADTAGNLVFRKSARNFNPDVATAGKICIAEVEEIVAVGSLDPDQIHIPSVYVHRIIKTETDEKRIEFRTTHVEGQHAEIPGHGDKVGRERIIKRTLKEFKSGMYVNLGIGIPTLCAIYLEPEDNITMQSENGILGLGGFPTESEVDADLINAGK